jgi:hypothetical protein
MNRHDFWTYVGIQTFVLVTFVLPSIPAFGITGYHLAYFALFALMIALAAVGRVLARSGRALAPFFS